MSLRNDRTDVHAQRDAYAAALSNLSEVLHELSVESKNLTKIAARGRAVDLNSLYALVQEVKRAEEDCDLRALDIATALGEDA